MSFWVWCERKVILTHSCFSSMLLVHVSSFLLLDHASYSLLLEAFVSSRCFSAAYDQVGDEGIILFCKESFYSSEHFCYISVFYNQHVLFYWLPKVSIDFWSNFHSQKVSIIWLSFLLKTFFDVCLFDWKTSIDSLNAIFVNFVNWFLITTVSIGSFYFRDWI